ACDASPSATVEGTRARLQISLIRISFCEVFGAGRCSHELAGAQSRGNRGRVDRPRSCRALALPASPASATPESFHAAFLGQRAADFAAAAPQASRTLGIPGANCILAVARSSAREPAMGPHVRGAQ